MTYEYTCVRTSMGLHSIRTMTRFRKKPVVIEAVQWTGRNIAEMVTFAGHGLTHEPDEEKLIISTLEGKMRADPMDWIIRGVKGELYPIKDSIFRETYEEVVDAPL